MRALHRLPVLGRPLRAAGVSLVLTGVALAARSAPEGVAPQEGEALAFVENAKLPPAFRQVELARADGSAATVFLGGTGIAAGEKRPLLVYVEGSGAQSLFYELEDGRLAVGMFGPVAGLAGEDYHVAAVEKRGVRFGEMGSYGAATVASEEYAAHATLANRAADVRLLVEALTADPRVDASRVVLLGHSEGADVVAAAAADNPAVTHVVFLSGGGPMQFYDFFLLRRKRMRAAGESPEAIEAAVEQLQDEVRAVLADPDSTTKLFLGHAHRRWSTFATQAPADGLVRAPARIFLAHGSEDTSVPVESFDFLVVRLLVAGHPDVTVRRYPGRDHSLNRAGEAGGPEGFLEVLEEALAWAARGPAEAATRDGQGGAGG